MIADEAKAILDSLALPGYAGGVGEIAKALRNALQDGKVESAQLVDYARHMGNASLSARLGCLLELLGQPAEGLEAPHGPLVLDPQRMRHGEYLRRWKVYLNLPIQELFPEGVG